MKITYCCYIDDFDDDFFFGGYEGVCACVWSTQHRKINYQGPFGKSTSVCACVS